MIAARLAGGQVTLRTVESLCVHLTTHQSLVRAGTEISPVPAGWSFWRVCSGRGYLMNGGAPDEINQGDFIVIPPKISATLRASLLGDVRLCHFGVQPEQLGGFFTVAEQHALSRADSHRHLPCVVRSAETAARQYADLCQLRVREPGVLVRSAMLSLAVQALRDILAGISKPSATFRSAECKLAELAARIPESELLRRSVKDLARECHCSERHLRRLFLEQFGSSLRHRQIVWRIEQAKRLLLDTDAKIIDIAGQSGFRSLGLFNATFKRLTRASPGAWRAAQIVAKDKHRRQHPPLCPRPSVPASPTA